MPPSNSKKRTRDEEALSYWVNIVATVKPESSKMNSFGGRLVKDAHRWGEAMVRAHLQCAASNGVPATSRHEMLVREGESWYMKGYRFYLLPTSNGAPPNIARHVVASPWMKELTLHQANPHSQQAAAHWREHHARSIMDECALEAEGERRRATASPSVPPMRAVASPAARPPPVQATKPRGPDLPSPLSQLLARPNDKLASQPRGDCKELVALAFLNLRVLRCWEENGRGERRIDYVDRKPYCMQLDLKARGFEAVYGGGYADGGDAHTMEDHGLHQVAGGSFNGVWKVRSRNESLTALLPSEVVAPFNEGRVVLRAPFGKTDWSTFDEAVGEAASMLFSARWRFGPRVAALSFARRVFFNTGEAPQEGSPVVKYKIFAWLERASMSVDKRFADTSRHSPVASSSTYHRALLVAIYQLSYQGFLHCDATLRNFVDFYGARLPATINTFAIKVIDVEAKTFRRLHPTATTEWRHLFLFNLLMVLVFLKIKLGSRWRAEACWVRVRPACRELISELPGTDNLAAISVWSGTFDPDERFPDLSLGEYAGETTEAASMAVMRMLTYYLLRQPLLEGRGNYYNAFATKRENELPDAKKWYDTVYRTTTFPARHFFLQRYHNRRAPEPFVQVAFDFLQTDHVAVYNAAPKLQPSNNHRVGMSESLILGLA